MALRGRKSALEVTSTAQFANSAPPLKRFGVFELDPEAGELRKNGRRLKLEGQPLRVLQFLLERAGHVVTREELQEKLWPADTFVDFEQGINSAIKRLRQALDDSAETPRYIETLPRRGYRFIYPIGQDEPRPSATPRPRRRAMWVTAAVALVLVLAAVLLLGSVLRNRGFDRARPAVRSVIVLPLVNLTGDPATDYLGRGFADDLTHEILRLDTWDALSFESGMRLAGSGKAPADVARELGVDACVAGTLQRDGERYRVNLKLVYASDNRQLPLSYWPTPDEMASLPRRAAVEIVQQAAGVLPPAMKARLTNGRQVNAKAYAAFNIGRNAYWSTISEEGHHQSIDFYRQAIAADPNYPEAYAAMGRSYMFLHQLHPTQGFKDKAREAVRKALELDPESSEAHSVLANVLRYEDDLRRAEEEYQLALRLNPRDALAHVAYSLFLGDTARRYEEALQEGLRAEQLDPRSAYVASTVIVRLNALGRFQEAIIQARKAQQLDPNLWMAHSFSAGPLWRTGRREEAIAEWEKALSLPGVYERWILTQLVIHYAEMGRNADARKAFERLLQLPDVEPDRLAGAYAAVGNKKKALDILKTAHRRINYDNREWFVFLRDDPEFQQLRAQAALSGSKRGLSR